MTATATARHERKHERRLAFRALLPEEPTLIAGLASVFAGSGSAITILSRQPNDFASSFPSEIVTCRLGDGRELMVLCKYDAGPGHSSHGHRGNVAYEADVYQLLLHPLATSAPKWYGAFTDVTTGKTSLVIEYVAHATSVSRIVGWPDAPLLAARWIGEFHTAAASHMSTSPPQILKTYDADFYREWAQRTAHLTAGLHQSFPWLAPLCARFGNLLDPLLARPTVIHGEFTPQNVLVQGERVCPVDWESAAIAAGEIDLAALSDGRWRAGTVDGCVRAYALARWPTGAPSSFATTLGVARLYWNFRWLGERADWTLSEKGTKRLGYLRAVAESLELI